MWPDGPFQVTMLDGTFRSGSVIGARAEWECPCGRRLDIGGEPAFFVTGGMRLDCAGCQRHYFLPGGVPVARERGVHEILLAA